MKVVGLITEHNPFHNGHLYHLTKAKELAQAEGVISIMSGNFLQRGEPALLNKWARAEMALKSGVDLVLELPVAYATRSAPAFARGSVEILHQCGVVTHLCFGSEEGSLEPLDKLANLLDQEPKELQGHIKDEMAKGLILPKARCQALAKYLDGTEDQHLIQAAFSPNNILGIEYIKALRTLKSTIIPLTIKRLTAGYHDTEITAEQAIASATGIRHLLFSKTNTMQKKETSLGSGENSDVTRLLPPPSWQILQREVTDGRGPISIENLALPLLFALRKTSPSDLEKIIDVKEGLENRILEKAQAGGSYRELVEAIKTKRFTWTRIQRILLHFLLGYTKAAAALFDREGPQYIRVLGFTPLGRDLLHRMKKEAALPVIIHPAAYTKGEGTFQEMLQLDIKSTNLYSLLYNNQVFGRGGQDFITKPVILN